MDLPGTAYLYTLAALSVTFVGFSALAIILRQTFGGEMSRLDILITRIFIQLGFIVVAASAAVVPFPMAARPYLAAGERRSCDSVFYIFSGITQSAWAKTRIDATVSPWRVHCVQAKLPGLSTP